MRGFKVFRQGRQHRFTAVAVRFEFSARKDKFLVQTQMVATDNQKTAPDIRKRLSESRNRSDRHAMEL